MAVTRRDVAKAAGVSTATVSNVLNNSDKVKAETAEHVRQVIKAAELQSQYGRQKPVHKADNAGGHHTGGYIQPFFAELAEDFERAADEQNYFVNICMGLSKLDAYFENFISRGLEGIFVTALPHKFDTQKLYRLVDNGIKVVASGNVQIDTKRISSLENDYEDGMWKIMEYLYKLGHREIAYLSGLGRKLESDCRCRFYLNNVKRLGLDYEDHLLIDGKFPYTTTMLDGYQRGAATGRVG